MDVQQSQEVSPGRVAAAARLRAKIDDRSAVVVVIGLGYIGTASMEGLLAAGFEVHGYDRDKAAVDRLRGHVAGLPAAAVGRWSASSDESLLARADIVLVAVRTLVRSDWSVSLEPLKAVARAIGQHTTGDRLVLIQSTLPPGTTRSFADEWLGKGDHTGLFVAHTPERLRAGDTQWTLKTIPHLVGGVDASSTELASHLLGTVCNTVVPVSSPEVSELSKLLENAFLAMGIGFIGEMTRLSHAMGISAEEVARAAATKPFGYFAFYPGAGIGGHCIPNDLQILRRAIRELGLNAPLLDGTSAAADDMPKVVVDFLVDQLREHGQEIAGSRVLLVGVGFKIGSSDTTDTPARDVVRYLRQLDAEVSFADSLVPAFVVDGDPVPRAREVVPGRYNAAIVLTGDASLPGEVLAAAVPVLLDAGGGRVHPGGLPGALQL